MKSALYRILVILMFELLPGRQRLSLFLTLSFCYLVLVSAKIFVFGKCLGFMFLRSIDIA